MSRSESTHPSAGRATVVVVLGVLAWLVLGGLTLAAQAWSVAWVVSLLVLGGAWFGCRALIRDIAERRVSEVDEYELAQRNLARNAGYVAAMVAALVLYVLLSVATSLAERDHDQLLLQAHQLVLVAFLPAAAGPSFLLAWRLRGQDDPLHDPLD